MSRAKIIKILDHKGIPEHIDSWMQDVEVDVDSIEVGESTVIGIILTSPVVKVIQSEENVYIVTEDCNYYLKKFI